MLRRVLFSSLVSSAIALGQNAPPQPLASQMLDACHGTTMPLKVMSGMPYVTVKLENASGYFVVDWGSLDTVVDAKGLLGQTFTLKPHGYVHKMNQDSYFSFAGLEFFGGGWNPIDTKVQDFNGVFIKDENGMTQKQVGILGADLISHAFFTVDYKNGFLYRSIKAPYCSDDTLRSEGLTSVSTAGYFADNDDKLNDISVFNIPTVPIRIGPIAGVAQVDSGFDDKGKHSLLINEAMLKALQDAGLGPVVDGTPESLSTCIGSKFNETITPYTLTGGNFFDVIGTSGKAVIHSNSYKLYLKISPADAKVCGGIGTWKIPAAQIGSSFLIDAGRTVYDPISSRIWLGNR